MKNTEKLFNDYDVKKFRTISRAARIKFEILNATVSLDSMMVPPDRRPEGTAQHTYSIRINAQWLICFVWKDGDPHDVERVDYH